MRRVIGVILAVVGVALLTGAAVLRLIIAPSVIKAPVEEEGKPFRSTTVATGTGALLNQQTGNALGDLPLRAELRVTADVPASTEDVAVWDVRTVITNTTNDTELRRTTDRLAFDRITSEAVIGYDQAADDKHGLDRQGTIAYKFPFHAKKVTYSYFDTETGKGWPAKYKGTQEIGGVQTYHYEQVIEPTVINEALFPNLLNLGDLTFQRVYSNTRQFFVEPTTGIIVRAEEDMKQALRIGRTDLETPALSASLRFTDDTISSQLRQVKQARQAIDAVQVTWPFIGGGTGLLLVVVGGLLVLTGGKQEEQLEVAATP
jgi:Porin PorA